MTRYLLTRTNLSTDEQHVYDANLKTFTSPAPHVCPFSDIREAVTLRDALVCGQTDALFVVTETYN